jgi:hypothetical protein
VKIPHGVKSLLDEELLHSFEYKFQTPTVTFTATTPPSLAINVVAAAPIYITWNQLVDPKVVYKYITVSAKGKKKKTIMQDTSTERILAILPKKSFPSGTQITVNIASHVPSLEGPLTSPAETSFSFTTAHEFCASG